MTRSLSTLLTAIVLLSCFAARADEAPRADVSRSKTHNVNLFAVLEARGLPDTIKVKDLTSSWRMLRTRAAGGASQMMQWLASRGDFGTGALEPDAVLFSRGDMISVGEQVYLVAYRAEPVRDPQVLRRRQMRLKRRAQEGTLPPFKIEESTTLTLSLLNLKMTGDLTDIRAFDPARDVLTEAEKQKNKVRDEREDSQTNLKQVALAVKQYVQDYDEKLPPMRAAKSAEQIRAIQRAGYRGDTDRSTPVQVMLWPYARNAEVFLHPGTGRPYLPNWRVSRKNEFEIDNANQIILFYEDAPDSEGLRNVAFLDGHVEAVDEAKWKRLLKLDKLNKLPP